MLMQGAEKGLPRRPRRLHHPAMTIDAALLSLTPASRPARAQQQRFGRLWRPTPDHA